MEAADTTPYKPKNIVICCDGTNNQLDSDGITNVLRLYRLLDHEDQCTYYDPGVGTIAPPGVMSPTARGAYLIAGLAFGAGFRQNLEEAYQFLIDHFTVRRDEAGRVIEQDRIFLFGFSRGAFTVRALAGMIHMCGLLPRGADNQVPYVSRLYLGKHWEAASDLKRLNDSLLGWPDNDKADGPRVEFLGLWDTVTSLGWVYKRKTLPYTASSPNVRRVRQALAIDERRAYFRQNRWRPPKDNDALDQEVREVWFAGVHSDVGGGYPGRESGLSKISLQWMIEQATASDHGPELGICKDRYRQIVLGEGTNEDEEEGPNPAAKMHESLRRWWCPVELLPMNHTLDRGDFFLPCGRRRWMAKRERVHASVRDRIENSTYKPSNLGPKECQEWEEWGGEAPEWPKGAVHEILDEPMWKKAIIGPVRAVVAYGILAYIALILVLVGLGLCSSVGLLGAPGGGEGSIMAWLGKAGHPLCAVLSFLKLIKIHPPEILLLLLPLIGFKAGAAFSEAATGESKSGGRTTFRGARGRLEGGPVYARFRGYDAQLLSEQLFQLHEDGRIALIRSLKRDSVTAVFYAVSLFVSLYLSARLGPDVLPRCAGKVYVLAVGVPVVSWLAGKTSKRLCTPRGRKGKDLGPFHAWVNLGLALACLCALVAIGICSTPGPVVSLPYLPWVLSWLQPSLGCLCLLPLVTLGADWLENCRLRQLTENYHAEVATSDSHNIGRKTIEEDKGRVKCASWATRVKLWTLALATILILSGVVERVVQVLRSVS